MGVFINSSLTFCSFLIRISGEKLFCSILELAREISRCKLGFGGSNEGLRVPEGKAAIFREAFLSGTVTCFADVEMVLALEDFCTGWRSTSKGDNFLNSS